MKYIFRFIFAVSMVIVACITAPMAFIAFFLWDGTVLKKSDLVDDWFYKNRWSCYGYKTFMDYVLDKKSRFTRDSIS